MTFILQGHPDRFQTFKKEMVFAWSKPSAWSANRATPNVYRSRSEGAATIGEEEPARGSRGLASEQGRGVRNEVDDASGEGSSSAGQEGGIR
jgi:hypothetical protein